jgi:membrane protease YdiL (CAAX protease family)
MSHSQPDHRPAPEPVDGRPDRPGWPEVLVGLAVLAVVAYGTGPFVLTPLGLSPVARGLALAALSGVAGIVGFLAACGLRIRSVRAFGVRATTTRWVLIGAAGGVLAFVATRVLGFVIVALGLQPENIQQVYTDAGGGGPWSVALSLVFLALLTPLGEELTFRGVVTTAFLRYGPAIGVIGSAVVFALMHGFNVFFFTALVVGLIAGELRRRSGSVWPGVLTHVVNNALAQGLSLALVALS